MNLHNTRTQNRLLGGIIGIGIAGIVTLLAYERFTPASFPTESVVATAPVIPWQPIVLATVISIAFILIIEASKRLDRRRSADESAGALLYVPPERRPPLNRENEYTTVVSENPDGYGYAVRDWDLGIQLAAFDEHDDIYAAVRIQPEEAATIARTIADWDVGEPVEVRDD